MIHVTSITVSVSFIPICDAGRQFLPVTEGGGGGRGSPIPPFHAQSLQLRYPLPLRAMHAYVYKSQRKPDTYVYLAAREDFSCLPDPLLSQLGALRFVLEVALTPGRTLATQDPAVVRENLAARGFHLQVPPSRAEDPMSEDWGTDA